MSHHLGIRCAEHDQPMTPERRPCSTCPPERTWRDAACRPQCPSWRAAEADQ